MHASVGKGQALCKRSTFSPLCTPWRLAGVSLKRGAAAGHRATTCILHHLNVLRRKRPVHYVYVRVLRYKQKRECRYACTNPIEYWISLSGNADKALRAANHALRTDLLALQECFERQERRICVAAG